jgi:DnaJ-class molecular chaperone
MYQMSRAQAEAEHAPEFRCQVPCTDCGGRGYLDEQEAVECPKCDTSGICGGEIRWSGRYRRATMSEPAEYPSPLCVVCDEEYGPIEEV